MSMAPRRTPRGRHGGASRWRGLYRGARHEDLERRSFHLGQRHVDRRADRSGSRRRL